MEDIEDFLKGPQIEHPEDVAEPEAQPEAPVGRDEKGRFAPKGEPAPEVEPSAPPALEEQHAIPPKALQEERRKRQEAERELAELRQRYTAPVEPPAPPPSLWDDEQGWQQHFGSQVVSTAVQEATLNARLDMSEMMARQNHQDFEEKKAVFLELMKENPSLQQKAVADPHPWNFAYTYATNHERMQQLAAVDVADLEKKLREQIQAELAAQKPATPVIPDSLADVQSVRSSASGTAPPSLDQILGRK